MDKFWLEEGYDYIMKHYKMKARDFIGITIIKSYLGWVRIIRPGSIHGP